MAETRSGSGYDPDLHAADSGLYVIERPLQGAWGLWDGGGTITLDPRLTAVERRSTLAHEIAHAELAHPSSSPNKLVHAARERAAWRLAASWLIDPAEYRQAERLYGPHPAALAWQLNVTVNALDAWQARTVDTVWFGAA